MQLWGWCMATVLDLVSFLVFLNSEWCGQAQLAQENISPIINMQLDSRKRMLTWNYIRNVSQQECIIYTPPSSPSMPNFPTTQRPEVREDNTSFCIFRNRVLHRGANLTVKVTCDGVVSQKVLPFANPGREGSGAVNFSCVIYNIRFMNCSWAPGPRAPADVRYQLFWWASLHEDEAECAHYVVDPTGIRVGCHFDELGEPQRTDNYFFLVNGTSSETAIPFLDFVPFEAYKVEKYDPPANVTMSYNVSHCIIRWENPAIRYDLSSHVLYYELDIQTAGSSSKTKPVLRADGMLPMDHTCSGQDKCKEGRVQCEDAPGGQPWGDRCLLWAPSEAQMTSETRCTMDIGQVFQRGQDPNVYVMPRSAVRPDTTIRVRVRYLYNDLWSEWSPTLRLGVPEQNFRGVLVSVVVAATAVPALVLMCLCKRFSVRHKLLPRIPKVKKEITGTFTPPLEVTWEAGHLPPGSQEPEDVLMVEEM